MAAKQEKPSSSWAISPGLTFGGGKGSFSQSNVNLTLFDVQAQIYIPLALTGVSIGGGLPGGVTLSTFSPCFFSTSKPLWASSFQGRAIIPTAELTVGIGSGLTYITFGGVDHDPYWLDIGGLEVGLSAGIGAGIYYCNVYTNHAWKNGGCLIAPGGDPLCGGESKIGGESPAYQSAY